MALSVRVSDALNSMTYFRELASFSADFLSLSFSKFCEGFMGLSFEEDFDGREKEKLMIFAACISSLRIAGDDGQGKNNLSKFSDPNKAINEFLLQSDRRGEDYPGRNRVGLRQEEPIGAGPRPVAGNCDD